MDTAALGALRETNTRVSKAPDEGLPALVDHGCGHPGCAWRDRVHARADHDLAGDGWVAREVYRQLTRKVPRRPTDGPVEAVSHKARRAALDALLRRSS